MKNLNTCPRAFPLEPRATCPSDAWRLTLPPRFGMYSKAVGSSPHPSKDDRATVPSHLSQPTVPLHCLFKLSGERCPEGGVVQGKKTWQIDTRFCVWPHDLCRAGPSEYYPWDCQKSGQGHQDDRREGRHESDKGHDYEDRQRHENGCG